MRKKYENKTPFKRFLHQYTGVLVLAIILSVVGVGFFYYQSTQVFFESWPCVDIQGMSMEHVDLTEAEHIRYHEIWNECALGRHE